MNKTQFQKFVEGVVAVFLSLIKVLIFSKTRPGINKIVPRSKNCVILGNGPSLEQSLNEYRGFLRNKDLFCVKFFPETNYFQKLKPRYYVNSDPVSWLDDVNRETKKRYKGLFANIATGTEWNMVLFRPYRAKKFSSWKEEIKTNKNIEVVYFNDTPVEGFKSFSQLLFRLNLGMPRPHNVLIPSIMLAINMGYQEIYLLGVDHSWLSEISVDKNNRVMVNQKHFYDGKEAQPKPMYNLGRGERRLFEVLTNFVYTFKGYFIINEYAEKRRVKIYNGTPDSFIDAFEKIDFPN